VFRIVIPARYASTRLPGKALLPLAGRPMIQWVCERAASSGAAEVLVATDDERIVAACAAFGMRAVLTSPAHPSGTDRIAEVARQRGWDPRDIVVNVQGDEPLVPPAAIAQVARLLAEHEGAHVATLAAPVESLAEFLDPNAVKVVADRAGRALYFSRAPIPWDRDHAAGALASQSSYAGARRHIGLYAYRVEALARLAALPPTPLERLEKLEQLRALENGLVIQVADACERPPAGVDTSGDLERVLAHLESSGGRA
jgi:3-deoxy-manno-octulosonate cytidylyltransferase (CMP-KDO synthetase)